MKIKELSEEERKYFVGKFQNSLELVQKGWTQWYNARDEDGFQVSYTSDKACSFCTLGATYAGLLHKNSFNPDTLLKDGAAMVAILREQPEMQGTFIASWNDERDRKQEDVVQLFKNIVKQLKQPKE